MLPAIIPPHFGIGIAIGTHPRMLATTISVAMVKQNKVIPNPSKFCMTKGGQDARAPRDSPREVKAFIVKARIAAAFPPRRASGLRRLRW
ncbi:MAG: hypothetical protein COT06_05995 [Syntrophobacteraceae bacterium CG07_land_8_20_14_0_80_61_8]|nr:MAG: hypothetical protein COT06_05995 [Syntrophobacteraceae bacterium CG07_land_8_20_14_0_80_61_8]